MSAGAKVVRGARQLLWEWRLRGWAAFTRYAPAAAALTSLTCVCGYSVIRTRNSLNKIVASSALERERSGRPEYLYVRDPAYEQRIRQHLQDEDAWSLGPVFDRWISGLRRSIWRRLLHISRNGDPADRVRALQHISALKHLKVDEWDWVWLSQRLDARAVVWLARHGGRCAKRLADRTPPLPASAQSLSLQSVLSNLVSGITQPCNCLKNFLQEQSDSHEDVQRLIEQETSGRETKKSDENSELLSSLEILLHHLDMTSRLKDKYPQSAEEAFAKQGGLAFIQKAASCDERSLQLCAARLMLRLSHYPDLLPLLQRSGLLSTLARWIDENENNDPELSCLAAGILAGLENSTNPKNNSEIYDPAVYLLYPTYRPQLEPKVDVIFVHGILGEPFVTWRQRDQIEDLEKNNTTKDINILDSNLSEHGNYEVVLRDIPESAIRSSNYSFFSRSDVSNVCDEEQKELSERSKCWPRDWLPIDCPNIRVLGVSYDTMMMEWSSCGGVSSTEDRALILGKALEKAGVGSRPIVWIAHSMGGLLVKHILVHSFESKNEESKKIANNTKGVIFFSTPHHGSRAAHALIWPSKEVQELRKDSKVLGRLHKRWLAGGWKSVCIGESLPTKLLTYPSLSLHLVPPDSADDNSGPLYTLPLDHLDICKPATRYSFIYRIVVEMIQHSKGEKCGKYDCENCSEISLNQSDVDLEKIYKKISTNVNNIYEEAMINLQVIFRKNIKLNNVFDEMYMEPNDLENNNLDERKETSKDIRVDGWWLNIMHF